ncbi:hypothetical protein Q5M87_09750 [Brachyspira innocens]|uniref:Uncharacterized protein n=1 Tax=Brachyspira innocens TaxID=13264 RepID=A0ABT8YZL0_9SPIR|nr:hypothetical protein [Brachyspira innocens]MDO6994289.1 hypothetical protein [Brachyspira innocens]MDO7020910.1 hypothetical protein [Brachyspira innocens]
MLKKLFILILSMIIIISCSKNNPNDPNNGGNGDGGTITEPNKYDSLFLKFITDIDTVPTFQFIKDNGITTNNAGEQISYTRSWVESTDTTNTCYIYKAPDGESTNTGNVFGQAVPVALSKLEIYAYRGINPFKTKNDNDIESQFYFYRYKGNAFVDLDNFLVAVDTKTGLVFPYAVPEKWETVVGNNAPKGWISAELGRTGDPNGGADITFTPYKFWQYDPIGQVNEDGSVTLEQFYIDAQKKGDYKPVYNGKSPYKDVK